MSEEEPSGDKPYEASQRKLDEARKRGELPRSADVTTTAAYLGFLLVAWSVGPGTMKDLGGILQSLLGGAGEAGRLWFGNGSAAAASGEVMGSLAGALAPWFVVPAAAALAAVFAQRAMVFAPEKLMPKLSRISPLSTAKQKFGMDGLFEFAKSSVKLAILSVLLGAFVLARLPAMVTSLALESQTVVILVFREAVLFLACVVAISVFASAIDFLWQMMSHQRNNRMSRKELEDEAKDTQGDPYMRQRRRDKAVSIATNRMLQDVPGADVVIVNPEHYAVALRWDRASRRAPVCVAKGTDEVAARIRDAASASGVPIRRDAPTARALFAAVDIGQEIPAEHYRAVAAAIRFADLMRQKAKGARR